MKFLQNRVICFLLVVLLCLSVILAGGAYAEGGAELSDDAGEVTLWYGSLTAEIEGNLSGTDPVAITFEDLGYTGMVHIYDEADPNNALRQEYELAQNENDEDKVVKYRLLRNMDPGVESVTIVVEYFSDSPEIAEGVKLWKCTVRNVADAPKVSCVVKKPGIDDSMLLSSGKIPAGTSIIQGYGAKGSTVCLEANGKPAGETVIDEREAFAIKLEKDLKSGDSVVVTYKNETGVELPLFKEVYEVSDRAELKAEHEFDNDGNLALNFTGEAGQGVVFTLRSADEKSDEKAVPRQITLTDSGTGTHAYPKGKLAPETEYIVEYSYEVAGGKGDKIRFKTPEIEQEPEVVESVDLIAPVITAVSEYSADTEVITGICSEEDVDIVLKYAGDAVPIATVKSGKDGSFRFETVKLQGTEKELVVVAVDKAQNQSEPVVVPTIIFTPSHAEIPNSDDTAETAVKPISIEVKRELDYPDDANNPDKILLIISAEPESHVKLTITEDNTKPIFDETIQIETDGIYKIPKNKGVIQDQHSYVITAVYDDDALAAQFEPTVFNYEANAPVFTDITVEISSATREITGIVSEPADVYLIENNKTIASYRVTQTKGQFCFTDLNLNPDASYAVHAVDDCQNIGKINLKFEPVFISNIEITADDNAVDNSKSLELTCWILAEEAPQDVALYIGDVVVPEAALVPAEDMLDILNNNADYSTLGDFGYCWYFDGAIDVSRFEPGNYVLSIRRTNTAGETVIIPDANQTDGLTISIIEGRADFGKLAFVLALLVLALVACIAVIVIIGRRIKFLQGASLDASNESNLTARYKSQL